MKKHRPTFSDARRGGRPPHDTDALTADLLRVLAAAPHPLRLDDILRLAGIPRRQKREALAELHRSADNGVLLRLRGGSWVTADSLKTMIGTLAMQRSGAAFVTPLPNARRNRRAPSADVYVDPEALGGAWNGDEVEVILLPARRGADPEGRVIRIVRRGQAELTARVTHPPRRSRRFESGPDGEDASDPADRSPLRALARPVDPRFAFDVLADVSDLPDLPEKGELIRVSVGDPLPSSPDHPLREGIALKSWGREDDVAVQEMLTKLNHLIPLAFPDDVTAEAEAVARLAPGASDDGERDRSRDIRNLPLVTIDGEDARDFDDAVHVEETENGWRLVVAIADVSFYVRPRSRLDREARERGNSYYFPSSVEPMLPEALSNGACSLRPGEDRRVLTADMTFDAAGAPRDAVFYAAVMRSRARLTYRQVQAALDGPEKAGSQENDPADIPADVRTMLSAAGRLATLLIERRRRRGGLDFDLPEAEFLIENGRVQDARPRTRLFSHRLVEAFMVAANEAVATFLTRKKAPFLYRVHPEPGPEKLDSLTRALRAADLPLPLPRREAGRNARWLPGLLEAAAGTGQASLVHRLALRSMMQARYTPDPEGHFGLASACYCHFTSPIRRYADLVTHRALRHALGLETHGPLPVGHRLLAVAEICNSRERAAQEAEREICRRLGCLLLENRTGEEFRGVISGVTRFGLFVELGKMPLEGMIRVESLGRDYYEYDENRQELRGRMTGEAWRLGEIMDVRVAEVNTGRLEITLLPAGSDPGAAEGGRPRRRTLPSAREPRGNGRSRSCRTAPPEGGKVSRRHAERKERARRASGSRTGEPGQRGKKTRDGR